MSAGNEECEPLLLYWSTDLQQYIKSDETIVTYCIVVISQQEGK